MAQNRSLSETCHKILRNSEIVVSTLKELAENKESLNVLEVGCGQGRAMLELAWMFRDQDITFYGINKDKTHELRNREHLKETIQRYQIMPEAEIDTFPLPEVFFYDAISLHFPDESIDLIYSAVSIRFIEDKAKFLEEISRVMRPGGIALLHIGESNWNYPYSKALENDLLSPHLNRFILKYNDELIPLPAYLKLFENDAFQFEFINGGKCVLKMQKLKSGQLDLNLETNTEFSMPLRPLQERHQIEKLRGGFRCVYNVPASHYDQLFEKGFLQKTELQTEAVSTA